MKKKIRSLLTIIALFVFSAFFCVSCSNNKNEKPTDFSYEYEQEFIDNCDSDMTIDGILDEARWQNQKVFTDKQYEVEVSYTTVFTEKGLYVGAKVKDEEIKWNARFNFATNTDNPMNSAFKINIRGPEVIDNHSMRSFNFYVDAFDKASRNQTRFMAASHTNGDVLEGEATEMTSELFVTWDALNIELYEGEAYPEFVRIVPYYRIVRSFTVAGENRWIKPNGTSPDVGWNYNQSYSQNLALNAYRPWSGIKFNASGYINFDAPDATMGNSEHGYAKTDGWDITQLSDGVLTATGTDEQVIYFRDVYSESYAVTTKMKIKQGALRSDGTREAGPAAGICNFNTILESDYFYISGNTVLSDDSAGWAVHTIEKVSGWTDVNHGRFEHGEHDPATDYIEITCYKDKENYYYLINGEPFVIKRLYWLNGPTAPGLYSLSAETEFIDYTVTDYTGKEAELDELIKEKFHRINAPGNIDGGKVTCDVGAVLPHGDAEILIQPSSGNIMTSFEIIGEDASGNEVVKYDYDYAVNHMELGVLKLENITSDMTVHAEFTRIDDDVAITVKGKVVDKKSGKAVTGANVVLTMPGEKRVFYVGQTSGNGSYNFKLPKAGKFMLGDVEIETDGYYRIAIFAENFRSVAKEIFVPATATEAIDIGNVELEKVYVGGTVTINGAIYSSQKPERWDLSGESENIVTALNNSSSAILYFTDAVSTDAVIDFTITNKTVIGEENTYETQPCMGITASDGNNQFSLFVLNEGVRVSPLGGWSKPGGNEFNQVAPTGINYSLRTSEEPQALTFRYIKSGSMVSLLYKDGDVYKEVIRLENSRLASMSAYALDVCNSKPCLLEFSNYEIMVGEDAAAIIKDAFYEHVELCDYDTAKGTITLEGVNEDGSVRYGEKFTLVNNTTEEVVVTFNGKTQMVKVGSSIELTANISGVIQVTFERELTSVSGTISVDEKYPNVIFNPSYIIITAESATKSFVYEGVVRANGEYEIFLAPGEYTLSVTADTFAARDMVSVGENAVADKNILLSIPFVAENVHEGKWQYNADGSYQAAAAGKVSGYLAGAKVVEGESFIMEVEIDDMSTELASAMGIIVGTKDDNYVEFALRTINPTIFAGMKYDFMRRRSAGNGNVQIYLRSPFENSLATEPFGPNSAKTLKLTLVYNGGTYFIFFNDELTFTYDENVKDMVEDGTGNKKSIKDVLGSGDVKFGLYSEGLANVGKFSSWNFSTDRSVLADYIAKTIKISEGVTVSVGGKVLTPVGNVVTVLEGDVVTLSKTVAATDKMTFKMNGNILETVCEGTTATATFTVTENVEILCEKVYLLSGVVTNGIASYEIDDYSTTEIKVMDGDMEVASAIAEREGAFSVYVPNGEYTVIAMNSALTGKIVSVSVENAATDNLEIVLDTPLFVSEFGLYTRTFHYENGVYHNEIAGSANGGNVGGYFAGAQAAEGGTFAIETELYDFATDGSPRGGFVVGSTTASNQFMSFTLRRRGDGTFDFARERIAGINGSTQVYAQNYFSTGVADTTTQTYLNNTPFGTNGTEKVKMALVYYHGDYYIFFNDVLAFIFNENTNDLASNTTSIKSAIGTGAVKFGLFAMEKPVHFTNWSYLVDEASVVSKYFPEGEEVISTVGKNNRTLYYDNGSYNNKIPNMNAYSTAGIYLAGAVAAENQTFSIEVTVDDYADVSGLGAGFIVGSATGAKTQFMAFALRRFGAGDTGCFDFVQERVAGIDGSTRVYGRSTFTDSTLTNYSRTEPLTMALVYKDNTYNIFFKLEEGYVKAFAFDENTTLDGGDLKQSTKTTIGTGAVRFGLYASEGGFVRLTDWSYLLDENAIQEKYFANV